MGYNQLHDFDYFIRVAKHFQIDIITEKLLAIRRYMSPEKKETNMSNMSKNTEIKVFNEYMEIRAHYFDDISDDIFIEAFQDYLKKKENLTSIEIECEKAFLMCKPQDGWNGIPPAGLRRLHELLLNETSREVLEKNYNLTVKDYYSMLENHLYQDFILENERRELKQNISCLEQENENLKQLIHAYADSTSWKLTQPLRFLGRKIRGN